MYFNITKNKIQLLLSFNTLLTPHPLYPPLLVKERGKEKKERLAPLLDAPLSQALSKGENKREGGFAPPS